MERKDKQSVERKKKKSGHRKRVCNREFATYKRRGEWVELLFMARAAERGFNVSKPWGDSARYDVSAELRGRFRRVQVKSTTAPRGDGGYVCCLKRTGIRYYRVCEVDFFAIYVVPEDAWFILPSRVVLKLKSNIRVAPGHAEQKYARFEEAWELLRGRGRRKVKGGNREGRWVQSRKVSEGGFASGQRGPQLLKSKLRAKRSQR